MEKDEVTTSTSKGQQSHANQPQIDSDSQRQSKHASSIFMSSTLCKRAVTGQGNDQWECRQYRGNRNASQKQQLSDLQHLNHCQCERPLKFLEKQTN